MIAFLTNRAHPLLLVALFAAALALRLATIASRSLWLDESFSVWMAAQPLRSAWRDVVALDQHPPLYYTLLHFWALLCGDSEASVRGFSALWGALTVPVIYLLGERIGGQRMGLLAALILLLAPIHVAYAQDARMYTLLTFNAACATLCATALLGDTAARTVPLTLHGPNSTTRRWWLGFILFSALVPLSHNTAILYFVALALLVIGIFGFPMALRRQPHYPQSPIPHDHAFRNWSLALAAALLLWSPWLPGFITQSLRVDNEFWIPPPTFGSIMHHWRDLVNSYGPGGPALPVVLLFFGALATLGAWRLRQKPQILALLLLLLFVPFVGELLVSVRRPIFYTRTLIWTSIPLYLLIAAGLMHLRPRLLAIGATSLVLLLSVAGLAGYYRSGDREGWRAAATWVAPQAQQGDLILFNAGWVQIPFDYYYRRAGPPVELRGLPVDMFERGILEPKMAQSDLPRLEQLTQGRTRVWLVYSHDWYTDPERLIPPFLDRTMRREQSRRFTGLQVFLYTRR